MDTTTTTTAGTAGELVEVLGDLAQRLTAEAAAQEGAELDRARTAAAATAAAAIHAYREAGGEITASLARVLAEAATQIAAAATRARVTVELDEVLRWVGDPRQVADWLALPPERQITWSSGSVGGHAYRYSYRVTDTPGRWSPERDPRTRDEYARRLAVAQAAQAADGGYERAAAADAAERAATEAERAAALADAVQLWGDETQRAAHAEGLLRTSEAVYLIEGALLRGPLDAAHVEHVAASADVRDHAESLAEVERVSSAAYRRLLAIRAALAQLPDSTLSLELERLTWTDQAGDHRGYTALLQVTWRGVVVSRRAVLDA